MKVLWLVTARAGSKSVPNKNVKLLNGIPLLAYRIISASKTIFPETVWISTDSHEYAQIAIEYGAQVPFIRPSYLAEDDSSSIDVILHAMNYANKNGFSFDYIGILEPTSPFISEIHLNNAILQLSQTEKANAIIAVKESRPNTIFIQNDAEYLVDLSKNLSSVKKLGRQKFKKQITPSGGFYIARWESFLHDKSFYTPKTLGFLVDDIAALEIDLPVDFLFAEFISNRLAENTNF